MLENANPIGREKEKSKFFRESLEKRFFDIEKRIEELEKQLNKQPVAEMTEEDVEELKNKLDEVTE